MHLARIAVARIVRARLAFLQMLDGLECQKIMIRVLRGLQIRFRLRGVAVVERRHAVEFAFAADAQFLSIRADSDGFHGRVAFAHGPPDRRQRRVRRIRDELQQRAVRAFDCEAVFHGALHGLELEVRRVGELLRETVPEDLPVLKTAPDRQQRIRKRLRRKLVRNRFGAVLPGFHDFDGPAVDLQNLTAKDRRHRYRQNKTRNSHKSPDSLWFNVLRHQNIDSRTIVWSRSGPTDTMPMRVFASSPMRST